MCKFVCIFLGQFWPFYLRFYWIPIFVPSQGRNEVCVYITLSRPRLWNYVEYVIVVGSLGLFGPIPAPVNYSIYLFMVLP